MTTTHATLGSRGLIIHDPSRNNEPNEGYFYVPEEVWRSALIKPQPVAMPDALLAKLNGPRRLFLNLDLLEGLSDSRKSLPGAPAEPAKQTLLNTGQSTAEIIIKDGNNFYAAPASNWQPLNDELSRSTPKVLVKRGAIVASIPPNPIPVGAYCVLINMAALG